MASVERRVRRLEERMDTSDLDAEARRRGKVRAELLEFEALMRSMGKQGKEDWRNSPEGQAAIRELEEAIGRKRRGA